MGERVVLDLWVCPDCGDMAPLEAKTERERWCSGWDRGCGAEMVRVRALVLDDAAVEDAARVLYDRFGDEVGSLGWAFEEDSFLDEWCEDARAVLGMEESDDD